MRWENSTAFFTAQLEDVSGDRLIQPKDVIGLHVTEEINQITSGSIRLRDNNNMYSRILRRGAKINISWGYKSVQHSLESGLDLAERGILRRGMQATVQGPSGGGGEDGTVTYNVGFLCTGMRGEKKHQVWESGTKFQCVQQVLASIGITTVEINFERMNEVYSSQSVERQFETDFQTLARWSREWRVIFRVGYLPNGSLAAVFIDPYRMGSSPTLKLMSGALVQSADLWYRAGKYPNVQSYSWQHQDGLNGSGDGVNVQVINGQTQFIRYHVQDETVTAWRLNTDRIQKELNKRDPGQQAQLTQEILQAKTFDEVKRFFDPIESKTAPNGIGYSCTGRMLGTPFLIPGLVARFYGAFPDFLTQPDSGNTIRFYFRKVEHDLSPSGYFTDWEVNDVFAQSPTGGIL